MAAPEGWRPLAMAGCWAEMPVAALALSEGSRRLGADCGKQAVAPAAAGSVLARPGGSA